MGNQSQCHHCGSPVGRGLCLNGAVCSRAGMACQCIHHTPNTFLFAPHWWPRQMFPDPDPMPHAGLRTPFAVACDALMQGTCISPPPHSPGRHFKQRAMPPWPGPVANAVVSNAGVAMTSILHPVPRLVRQCTAPAIWAQKGSSSKLLHYHWYPRKLTMTLPVPFPLLPNPALHNCMPLVSCGLAVVQKGRGPMGQIWRQCSVLFARPGSHTWQLCSHAGILGPCDAACPTPQSTLLC